jgi:hypothetical protein
MLALKPSHVILSGTSDTDRDGVPDAAYFPSRHLPARADLLNRAAWQLSSRVDVKVLVAMPVDSLRLAPADRSALFEDLGRRVNFDGLVFDDGDQATTQALAVAARQWRALKIARRHASDAAASSDTLSDYVLQSAPASLEALPAAQRRVYVISGHSDGIAARMRALQLRGALNFGYRDDFLRDAPRLEAIAPAFSLRIHPR